MINPAVLIDTLVAKLQAIPEVVRQLGGNPTRIYAYADAPPAQSSLVRAIYQMISPSVMIAWSGTSPAHEGNGLFGHELSIYVRADDSTVRGTPTFANLVTAILNGFVPGDQVKLLNSELLDDVLPMEVPMIRRIHDEEGTIDLFEITTRIDEKQDNNG